MWTHLDNSELEKKKLLKSYAYKVMTQMTTYLSSTLNSH